jgi:hypothetical protein
MRGFDSFQAALPFRLLGVPSVPRYGSADPLNLIESHQRGLSRLGSLSIAGPDVLHCGID